MNSSILLTFAGGKKGKKSKKYFRTATSTYTCNCLFARMINTFQIFCQQNWGKVKCKHEYVLNDLPTLDKVDLWFLQWALNDRSEGLHQLGRLAVKQIQQSFSRSLISFNYWFLHPDFN